GKLISKKENIDGKTHASLLTVFIEGIFKESEYQISDLDAIAVSKGPGSYTGLRIGVSAAKGIAYAAEIPLISVSTLQALAFEISKKYSRADNEKTLFCPMIDARRMEVYSAFYNSDNEIIKEITADIIDEDSYKEFLSGNKLLFFGNGAEKCKNTITSEKAEFIENIICSAENMVELSEKAFQNSEFEDVAYFEPFYLKNFIATIPRKNIIG
ncbi:MAG: tRNA (adenosine(37)-N6)-threonylcarbamoyltransferase complex dimerization subunit type 1 TsaB, partial [Bacteroidales bacterium]|nr:tRNA (adenosine(37)-N6)-threonylcarbamoyltransferase complex dimerization subunit type 1 TsaB [Bacteroidales bacterium]MBN2755857.1 tRNA (adenosine(37)-N6)-threonylcarbamoyltransferase complex dimerization subunit type 1 TsaB [Bacteroidales bacterium]